MKKTAKQLIFLTFLSVLIFSCGSEEASENDTSQIYPLEISENELILTYDSTIVIDTVDYEYYKNCEIYFTDNEKNVWRLHASHFDGNFKGYKLFDLDKAEQYKGAKFKVEWEKGSTKDTKSNKELTTYQISSLKLIDPDKYLKRKLVKVTPEDDFGEIIYNCDAGDSVVFASGNYTIKELLWVYADHVTLNGEPGTFIYANKDNSVIDISASNVRIKNIYFSHLNSQMAECSGDVVFVNTNFCKSLYMYNCDINGCGVVGINMFAYSENTEGNYHFVNNYIHNNSQAAISIENSDYQEEVNNYKGIAFKNNKIWNNGEDKIDEPYDYKQVFLFGLPDSISNNLRKQCKNINIYNYESVLDSDLPYHGFGEDSSLVIGYINPLMFADGKFEGVLIYERFKPIQFYDKVPEICDPKDAMGNNKIVLIYADSLAEAEYFNEGGEDWSWFTNDVYQYYDKKGIKVLFDSEAADEFVNELLTKHTDAKGRMGYFFIYGENSIYYGHDMPDGVIQAGDQFFNKP